VSAVMPRSTTSDTPAITPRSDTTSSTSITAP
jgi:hypothetical protein